MQSIIDIVIKTHLSGNDTPGTRNVSNTLPPELSRTTLGVLRDS
jgi:hypothetical protein